MLCHQCGSPVDASEGSCQNCGAELSTTRRLKLSESRGLRISQELKAIRLDQQIFPPGEEVATRFVLGEMIGKGPFGEVYRARDKAIDAEVAVKIFAAEVLKTPLDEERFLRATRAGRRLTQQNAVRLHDSGVHKGHPWVSMQLLEGLGLRKVLDLRQSKGETFELDEIEPIVTQITLALQHVSRDFPHGDLKPENIVFLPDLIKVTDSFLLAALPAKAIIPRLRENAYFAPELHAADTEPTSRADVYSVGVIIGEMLFGPDYTPGSRGNGPHAAIDGLIKRATAFDPEERYPTVEALSEDLATVIDTGAMLARPAKPPTPPDTKTSAPPAPPPGPAPSEVSEVEIVEEIATVEYSRDLDAKLQDSILTNDVGRDRKDDDDIQPLTETDILTREVKRDVPKGTSRTITAAVPKPDGRIPSPRPVQDGPPVGTIVLVLGVIAALIIGIVVSQRKDAPVEEIGQTPEEIAAAASKNATTEPPATTNAVAATTNSSTATQTNGTTIAPAVAQAATGLQSATASALTAAAAPPEVTPTEEPPNTTDTTSRPPSNTESTGSPAVTKTEKVEKKTTGTDCAGGMRLVKSSKHGNYCIDRYEYPGGGVKPKTSVSWFQANKLCESKGKRLCELKEWRNACGARYPYGSKHDPDKCNTADEDGFERSLAKTGSFKQCRSRASGAFDMVGNAHEWVKEQRIAGGGFESDEEVGSCRYSSPKSPASSAGYIGFRCCADPQ